MNNGTRIKLYFLPTCSSTNELLKDEKYPLFSALLCETQTAGKGRWGRKWFSLSKGGIYISIKLPKEKKYQIIFPLTIIELFNEYSLATKFLWPNDVYVDQKKISGILNETIHRGHISYTISGAGINLNQSMDEFPNPLKEKATSYYIEKKRKIKKDEFVDKLILKFEENTKNSFSEIAKKLISYSLLKRGDKIIVSKRNETYEVIYEGIDEEFSLCARVGDKMLKFYSGEVLKIER